MHLIKKNLLYDKSNKNPMAPIGKPKAGKPPKVPGDLLKELGPAKREASIRQSRDSEKLFPAVPTNPPLVRQASVDRPAADRKAAMPT